MIYTKETLETRSLYYYADDFNPQNIEALKAAYDELENMQVNTPRELLGLLYQASELISTVNKVQSELFYRTIRNTSDIESRERYNRFNSEIATYADERSTALLRRFYDHPLREQLNQDSFTQINQYFEAVFGVQSSILSELRNRELKLITEYRDKINQLSFTHQGQSYFFKDSAAQFANPDPMTRIAIWNARKDALIEAKDELHEMFDTLVHLRHRQAQACGFAHFYELNNRIGINSSLDIKQFRELLSILRKHLNPLVQGIFKQWQKKLGSKVLSPFDCEINPDVMLLQPFVNVDDLTAKAIRILYDIRFEYGLLVNKMWNSGYMDLPYAPEKAPGQFYFGDIQSGACKIMMNCLGSHDDMVMLFHELGHVLHFSSLMKNPLFSFMSLPLGIKEIASQAIVYVSSTSWGDFYPDPEMLKTAIRCQYSNDVLHLARSACNAAFELELYANPDLSSSDREILYRQIYKSYFPCFEDIDIDEYISSQWLLKMSVYEFPFYDINSSISLLAAWQIIKHYHKDKDETSIRLHRFFSKSGEYGIGKLCDILGIKHDFSEANIRKVLDLVRKNLK